jgi:hypothetical protein
VSTVSLQTLKYGHVLAYEFGTDWQLLGDVITGSATIDVAEDMRLSMDNAGNRIAFGEIDDGRSSISAQKEVGRLSLYDWNGTAWQQYEDVFTGASEYDGGGVFPIAISGDGLRVAFANNTDLDARPAPNEVLAYDVCGA